MPILVNGRTLPVHPTLLQLLRSLDLDPQVVVVELNQTIVPGEAYAATPLRDGDSLEIVSFVGGG